MSEVVDLNLEGDLGRELIVDCVQFAEGLLDEKAVRKKYRFDDNAWEALGSNDEFVEKIEAEKLRRVRDGSSKREKAQALIVKAPDVLSGIMNDAGANPRHRIDSAKALDDFASNGPGQSAPASDRFIIQINLGSDTLKFDKSRKVDANDADPNHNDGAPQGLFPTVAVKKKDDDQW